MGESSSSSSSLSLTQQIGVAPLLKRLSKHLTRKFAKIFFILYNHKVLLYCFLYKVLQSLKLHHNLCYVLLGTLEFLVLAFCRTPAVQYFYLVEICIAWQYFLIFRVLDLLGPWQVLLLLQFLLGSSWEPLPGKEGDRNKRVMLLLKQQRHIQIQWIVLFKLLYSESYAFAVPF